MSKNMYYANLESRLRYEMWCHNRKGYGDRSKEIRTLEDLIYAYRQGMNAQHNKGDR